MTPESLECVAAAELLDEILFLPPGEALRRAEKTRRRARFRSTEDNQPGRDLGW